MTNHCAISPMAELHANGAVPFTAAHAMPKSVHTSVEFLAAGHLATIKALLDDVNVEDKACVEQVYAGICAGLSAPGPLSHLERPSFEFAQYLAGRMPA